MREGGSKGRRSGSKGRLKEREDEREGGSKGRRSAGSKGRERKERRPSAVSYQGSNSWMMLSKRTTAKRRELKATMHTSARIATFNTGLTALLLV
jgi:hypothetical protein